MSSISDAQLARAGLLSDMILGFRAAMRGRLVADPTFLEMPEHFSEERNLPRLLEFRRGARIGLTWRRMRMGASTSRRESRNEQFRTQGIAWCIDPDMVRAEALAFLHEAIAQADGFGRPSIPLVNEIVSEIDLDRSWWNTAEAIAYYGPDGRNGILSPIYPTNLKAMGETGWTSAEAVYHAQKFPDDIALQDLIKEAPDALAAKAVARKNRGRRRRDWSSHRIVAMTRVLVLRTEQDAAYRTFLQICSGRDIVEDTTQGEHHKFWGVVSDFGTNVAGQIAMLVRDRLAAGDDRLILR